MRSLCGWTWYKYINRAARIDNPHVKACVVKSVMIVGLVRVVNIFKLEKLVRFVA